jgi:anti-anti-sigma factor
MLFTSQIDGDTGTIRLEGRFTFESHPAFKACTQQVLLASELRRLVLDMEAVTYMDASSLGAVLLLREATEARFMQIALQRPSQTVLKLLRVVQFEKLFEIQP